MDKGGQPDLVYDATMKDKEKQAMIHHCRMGHVSFDKMSRIFLDVMCRIGKGKLACNACEYAKHTRAGFGVYLPLCLFIQMYGPAQWCQLTE